MFNTYMNNHFTGCIRIAETRDPHRDRPISLFAIPGETDVVGISDGTDAWIASSVTKPLGVNVRQLLHDLASRPEPVDDLFGESVDDLF
jgi:hypothetical protein